MKDLCLPYPNPIKQFNAFPPPDLRSPHIPKRSGLPPLVNSQFLSVGSVCKSVNVLKHFLKDLGRTSGLHKSFNSPENTPTEHHRCGTQLCDPLGGTGSITIPLSRSHPPFGGTIRSSRPSREEPVRACDRPKDDPCFDLASRHYKLLKAVKGCV